MGTKFYFQFLLCLLPGLLGLCTMLRILFDTLLADWDMIADLFPYTQNPSRLRRSFIADREWDRRVNWEETPQLNLPLQNR